MIGLIQTVLLDLVHKSAGEDAVAEVKRRASVPEDREFRIDTVYDDNEWQRMFKAACEVLNITEEQAYEAYADAFCTDAMKRWPAFFSMAKSTRDFLERQPAIHNYFATGIRDEKSRKAINDKFHLDKLDDRIIVHYCSPNRLCALYAYLAKWLFNHYNEKGEIKEHKCMKNGHHECEIHVIFGQHGDSDSAREKQATS